MVEKRRESIKAQELRWKELDEKLYISRIDRIAFRAHELWREVVARQRGMEGRPDVETRWLLDLSDEAQKEIFWMGRMAGKGENGVLRNYRLFDKKVPSIDIAEVDLNLTAPLVQERAKEASKKARAIVDAQDHRRAGHLNPLSRLHELRKQDVLPVKELLQKQQRGERLSFEERRFLKASWAMEGLAQLISSQNPFYQERALVFIESALKSKFEDMIITSAIEGYFYPLQRVLSEERLPYISRENLFVSPDYEISDKEMLAAFAKARSRGFEGYPEYIPDKPYDPEDPTSSQCFGLTEEQYAAWIAASRPINILVDLDAYLAFTRDGIPLGDIPDVVYPPARFAPWFVRAHPGRTSEKYNRFERKVRRPDQPVGTPQTLDPDLPELLSDSRYTDGVQLTHLGEKQLTPYEKEMIVDYKVGIIGNGFNWKGLQKDAEGNWIGNIESAIDVMPLFINQERDRYLFRLMYVQVNAEGRRAIPGETENDDPRHSGQTRIEGAKRTLVEELGFTSKDLEDIEIDLVYENRFGGDQRNTLFSGRYRISEAIALLGKTVLTKILEGALITNDPAEIYEIITRPASRENLSEMFGIQPVASKAALAFLMRKFPGLAVDKDGYIGRLED